MIRFSIIVPVYNRPEEIYELLESLSRQTFNNFEVIVVEDGSSVPCDAIVRQFKNSLNIFYHFKPNTGPGLSRNYGVEHAHNEFFVFLDSDCVLPPGYVAILSATIAERNIECFGGPDVAHENFTPVQKAINYSMTSFFTTGGIRGGRKKTTHFHPRSFNMGFSRQVYESTKGFSSIRFGEDIDLSIRIEAAGFQCELILSAFVYHKRRTDFKKFFKQITNSGIARINLFKRHPRSLKLTHFFPAAFVLYFVWSLGMIIIFNNPFFSYFLLAYLLVIFFDASWQYKNTKIGGLAVVATVVQMFSYGIGFLRAFIKIIVFGQGEFEAYKKNFYK